MTKKKLGQLNLRRYVIALAVAWTLIAGASLWWSIYHEKNEMFERLQTEARNLFNRDLLYRRWAAGHGGVYVPVTEKTQPNPYLSHLADRDVTTQSGHRLTLMNPAYMTRQVYELATEQFGGRGHITSLNPLRSENAAEPWEEIALQAFALGEKEISSLEMIGDVEYFRLMRPLHVEERCLKCHAIQGYKEGDLRGGHQLLIALLALQDLMVGGSVGLHHRAWDLVYTRSYGNRPGRQAHD